MATCAGNRNNEKSLRDYGKISGRVEFIAKQSMKVSTYHNGRKALSVLFRTMTVDDLQVIKRKRKAFENFFHFLLFSPSGQTERKNLLDDRIFFLVIWN